MRWFPCCSPVPAADGGGPAGSVENVGGFAEWYVIGTSGPFEFRTIQSSDGSITVTQNANDIDLVVAGGAPSMANVGVGVEWYVAASSSPFNIRRANTINDATDPHGKGNLAWWNDGIQNRVDLPRLHFESDDSVTTAATMVTLFDHTFGDDSAGAGVAGKDGEDWLLWWTLMICAEDNFDDSHVQIETHDGAVWTIVELFHTQCVTDIVPSWPVSGNLLLSATNWSGNSGLRIRMRVRSDGSFTNITFENPRLTLNRYNRNNADNT